MNDLVEGLEVCVAYLRARLLKIGKDARAGRVSLVDTDLRQLLSIGRDLSAAIENCSETAVPQYIDVRFTNSESKPQNIVCGPDT